MTQTDKVEESNLLDAAKHDVFSGAPSFSFGNRAHRALFGLAWLVLCRWTPPPLHGWRCAVLRLFGAKIGKKVRIYGSTRVWFPPNLEMDDYSVMGPEVNCYCQGRIHLGDYAIVSQFTHLVSGTHDIADPHFQLIVRPITIGANAWVAANAFVGPGVAVGEGAVLGACGVAFKDLDPWTVYAGNPAKMLKPRPRFVRGHAD